MCVYVRVCVCVHVRVPFVNGYALPFTSASPVDFWKQVLGLQITARLDCTFILMQTVLVFIERIFQYLEYIKGIICNHIA